MESGRTTRKPLTPYHQRIADAVSDPAWQEFRVSLKGRSTREKLAMLKVYYNKNVALTEGLALKRDQVDVRVDNYIKSLCRGGQLFPGESLASVTAKDWKPRIRK